MERSEDEGTEGTPDASVENDVVDILLPKWKDPPYTVAHAHVVLRAPVQQVSCGLRHTLALLQGTNASRALMAGSDT